MESVSDVLALGMKSVSDVVALGMWRQFRCTRVPLRHVCLACVGSTASRSGRFKNFLFRLRRFLNCNKFEG